MQGFLLTLLEISEVHDMVWMEKLLLHMLDTGIPYTFIGWI